jgi:hypothetical protein
LIPKQILWSKNNSNINFKSTLFCGIIGSLILESYGWRYTFQLIGIMSLAWVLYFRNNVVLKSRARLNMLNAKESILNPEDPLQLNPGALLGTNLSPLPPNSNSVPWMDILNKPAFWLVSIFLHKLSNANLFKD